MEWELEPLALALLCGAYFIAGIVDSIAGGGGLITVPAFLLTGVPADIALGTNKLAVGCGIAAALRTYARSGLVVWRSAKAGGIAVLVGAMLGARVMLLFSNETIGKIVVVLLPLAMLATLMPRKEVCRERELFTDREFRIRLSAICFTIGFYEGFFGPGGGSFFILALHFFLSFNFLAASATTKYFDVISAVSSLAVFMWHGKVLYLIGLPLAAANICGSVLGSRMAMQVGPGLVRKVLTFSLALLFASLVWKFWLGG